MERFILAHDLGTSGNKATLYSMDGNLKASVVEAYETSYGRNGEAEQDPDSWWQSVCLSTKGLFEKSGVSPSNVECVTFSGQMMGCLPVDSEGMPLRRSMIWADHRSSTQVRMISDSISMDEFYRITGHRISESYSAAKLLWVRDNEPGLFSRMTCMLQAKDYIIYRLTGRFVTDYSDASGTNLFDIRKKDWSGDILRELHIDRSLLPEAHPSTDTAGGISSQAAHCLGLKEGTPVIIGGGDGSCAAVGAGAVCEGRVYNVIGTSSWISRAAKTPFFDQKMRTFNWVSLDPSLYTPCGTMQAAGESVRWVKNNLAGEETQRAHEKGESVYHMIDEGVEGTEPGAGSLLFLPYLLGERSPWWNPKATGAFLGLRVTTTRAQMHRAVLEGVAYNLRIILDLLDSEGKPSALRMVGGGAKSRVWLQILADVFQRELVVPRYLEEATSMGAAVCGGIGIGAFPDFSVIDRFNPVVGRILPRPETYDIYKKLYGLFLEAYRVLCPIYEKL